MQTIDQCTYSGSLCVADTPCFTGTILVQLHPNPSAGVLYYAAHWLNKSTPLALRVPGPTR